MDTYLLKKQTIDDLPGTEKTHFLNDAAVRTQKSLGDLTGLANIGFHLITVPPGQQSTELHQHYFEEECVYVMAGEATAVIGSEQYSISAGDFIGYRAGGLAHTISNSSQQPLTLIVVGQRLAHDVCDYPEKNKRLFRSRGLPWDLANKNQLIDPKSG